MHHISKLKPKKVDVDVKLIGGAKALLSLRPFTLADYAWFQEEFESEEKQFSLADAKIEPIAQIIWYQMTVESKRLFGEITFKDVDNNNNEITIQVKGYKKLLHSIDGEDQFWKLLDAYLKCKGLNGFTEKSEEVGLKKKCLNKLNNLWIGLKSLIFSPFNMGTRRNKFFH